LRCTFTTAATGAAFAASDLRESPQPAAHTETQIAMAIQID
jgi:hypothetical protein